MRDWGIRIREDDMLYCILSIVHIQRAATVFLCAGFAHKKRGAARWRNWGFYEVHAMERFRKFLLPSFRSSAGMALKFCRIRNMNFTVEKFHGRGKSLPLSWHLSLRVSLLLSLPPLSPPSNHDRKIAICELGPYFFSRHTNLTFSTENVSKTKKERSSLIFFKPCLLEQKIFGLHFDSASLCVHGKNWKITLFLNKVKMVNNYLISYIPLNKVHLAKK